VITAQAEKQLVVDGLAFPTSLEFDDEGTAYVAEAGVPWAGAEPGGRVYRLEPDGSRTLLADGLRYPVNGVTYHEGALYITEGGREGGRPSRISRVARDGGQVEIVVDGLPGPGNYHASGVAFGPHGKMYFSQGAMTNTGVIGLDSYELGWLKRLPHEQNRQHANDVPPYELELRGVNFESTDPFADGERVITGAFAQFGTPTERGQRVPAGFPCTAAVMRCEPDGSGLELVAWGVRNAYGLGFLPDGRLVVTDQGADDRGSRPVGKVPDVLLVIEEGAWYGWPDFIGGEPITDPKYRPASGDEVEFVIANHDELPPLAAPVIRFDPHVCAVKFGLSPEGKIVVALFGDEIPMVAPTGPRVGRSLAIVDPDAWSYDEVALLGLRRPIQAIFDPEGQLYVVDFGLFEPGNDTLVSTSGSGAIWRLPWPLV
jgi:Glucose / Sorbosone dehydrogenase